jgi:small subunit ribosomal protein S7
MSRKKISQKRLILVDPIYNSELVAKLINKLLKDGKKSLAQKICYVVMKNIGINSNSEPLPILIKAIKNVTPIVEVRARRIGGSISQIPIEVGERRGNSLALKFIVNSARSRPGKNIIIKLQNEIMDAFNNLGGSIKKKEEIHKKAESSKSLGSVRK